MTETMEEKLNKVLWDNLCIDVIEMDSISYETLRPMKAKLQPELESFIKEEISLAISSHNKELVNKIGRVTGYTDHERSCILSDLESGEPTKNGYRQKYRGKWYESLPVDRTPKCDCGLSQAIDQVINLINSNK